MTKLKSLKLRYYAALTLALVLGTGAYLGVRAYSGEAPQNVAEAGATINVVNNYTGMEEPVLDDLIGAVSGPELPNPYITNGEVVYTFTQTFADGTLIISTLPSPFITPTTTATDIVLQTVGGIPYTSASSTVDLARLQITGVATTSVSFECGAATSSIAAPNSAQRLIVSGLLTTSTVGYIENNLTAAQGAAADGGTVAKIAIGPAAPYFNCKATETVAGGLTGGANTFDGKLTVRIKRTR